MNRILLLLIASLVCSVAALAGVQQDFFISETRGSTGVRIVKIGPDHEVSGALRHHVLLDSNQKKDVDAVSQLIELRDPVPVKRRKEEDVWVGSVLMFGVAEYLIEFRRGDEVTLRYGMDRTMKFLTPMLAHAPQGIDMLLDYPLTRASAKKLKRFVGRLKEEPIQSAQTTPQGCAPRRV